MTRLVGNMRSMTDHSEATSATRQFAPLAIILGIPLVFAAVFFYTTPVVLETGGEQGIFICGSPSEPNVESKNTCEVSESIAKNKAIYSGLSAVGLLGLGAVWMLRGQRHEDDWDDERPSRHRDDDIDLRRGRADRDERDERPRSAAAPERPLREADEPLRGVERSRLSRLDDDLDTDSRDLDSRAERRRAQERRPLLRDDDFGEAPPRPRPDDDWSSDGWR